MPRLGSRRPRGFWCAPTIGRQPECGITGCRRSGRRGRWGGRLAQKALAGLGNAWTGARLATDGEAVGQAVRAVAEQKGEADVSMVEGT